MLLAGAANRRGCCWAGLGSALSVLLLGLEQGRRAGPTQWQGRGSSRALQRAAAGMEGELRLVLLLGGEGVASVRQIS